MYHTLRKCLFLEVLQAANECPRKRKHASSSHSLPRSLSYSPAPCIDPWEADRGRLIAALRICGAVFLRILPDEFEKVLPDFSSWHTLWKEALEDFKAFCSRSAVRSRQLRFSKGEDLLRTRVGESKAHTPDVRYNFGLGQDALRSKASLWGRLFAELFGSHGFLQLTTS